MDSITVNNLAYSPVNHTVNKPSNRLSDKTQEVALPQLNSPQATAYNTQVNPLTTNKKVTFGKPAAKIDEDSDWEKEIPFRINLTPYENALDFDLKEDGSEFALKHKQFHFRNPRTLLEVVKIFRTRFEESCKEHLSEEEIAKLKSTTIDFVAFCLAFVCSANDHKIAPSYMLKFFPKIDLSSLELGYMITVFWHVIDFDVSYPMEAIDFWDDDYREIYNNSFKKFQVKFYRERLSATFTNLTTCVDEVNKSRDKPLDPNLLDAYKTLTDEYYLLLGELNQLQVAKTKEDLESSLAKSKKEYEQYPPLKEFLETYNDLLAEEQQSLKELNEDFKLHPEKYVDLLKRQPAPKKVDNKAVRDFPEPVCLTMLELAISCIEGICYKDPNAYRLRAKYEFHRDQLIIFNANVS